MFTNKTITYCTFTGLYVFLHLQAQYIFIHDAILEGVESGKTDVPADRLRNHVENLSKLDKSTGETGFENEFRVHNNKISLVVIKNFL